MNSPRCNRGWSSWNELRPRMGQTVWARCTALFNPIRGWDSFCPFTLGSLVPRNPGLFTFKPSGLGAGGAL
jgi:hypothetical protein